MANPLPEVIPDVTSMPTTGWRIQTGGSARRRIASNKGNSLSGHYDVRGIPGHTHNASAVVSVNADYTRYRTVVIDVGANVWAYGALNFPVHMLVDSIDPDNAEERYERAIERCIGYITLRPENCMSSIREPTRSIGEVRTLVTPKARLDTLTYVEEQGGWRVPDPVAFPVVGGVPNTGVRALLGSSYPNVAIDMRPLTVIRPGSSAVLDSTPSNLFIQGVDNYRWRILGGDEPESVIGTMSDGATPWNGTITFKWDPDARLYKSEELTVRLNTVHELTPTGAAALEGGYPIMYDDFWVGNGHRNQIYVTFPAMKTSEARDGYCWLSNIKNEEALSVATQDSGLNLPRWRSPASTRTSGPSSGSGSRRTGFRWARSTPTPAPTFCGTPCTSTGTASTRSARTLPFWEPRTGFCNTRSNSN